MYKFFNDNFLHDFDLANWLFWKVLIAHTFYVINSFRLLNRVKSFNFYYLDWISHHYDNFSFF